jgi:ATP synthase I chain
LVEFAALEVTEKGDRQSELAESATLENSTGEAFAFTDPKRVERRVWRNICVVIALAVIVAAAVFDLKMTLGVALGGALALLNYKWLHSSLRAILSVGSEKPPPGTRLKIIVRWLVVAAIAWAAHQTGYFDAVGIIAGLLAPAVAVMIEAAYVTYKTIAQPNGER